MTAFSSSVTFFDHSRIVDLLAVRCGDDADDVARAVAAVHLVSEHRRPDRFAAVVEEAALGDVFAQIQAKTPPIAHSATMTAMTMYRNRYTIRPHQANT